MKRRNKREFLFLALVGGLVLGACGAPPVQPRVASLLQQRESPEPRTREVAARTLHAYGKRALPTLQRALSHSDWKMRLAALKTLAEAGPPAQAFVGDIAALRDDPHPAIRRAASAALETIQLTYYYAYQSPR